MRPHKKGGTGTGTRLGNTIIQGKEIRSRVLDEIEGSQQLDI